MNQTNKEKRKTVRIETEIAKKKTYNYTLSESAPGNYKLKILKNNLQNDLILIF